MPPRINRRTQVYTLLWLLIAIAGIASIVAGRGFGRHGQGGGQRPFSTSDPAASASATALANAVTVNGRLQFADAAFEADDPASARAAIAQAATSTARDGIGGPAGALSEAFSRYVAAEDALAAGDRTAARSAYATADAAFETALDGGALPGIVEPTHLFSEAGVLYVDGQATLEAGDVEGALTLLRAAESRRGDPFRPLLLTVEARAAATPRRPTDGRSAPTAEPSGRP